MSGGHTDVHVKMNDMNAKVTLGDDSEINAKGEVLLAAWSRADAETEGYSNSFGIFGGFPEADARSVINSENIVTTGEDSQITAEEDVKLLAGQSDVLEDISSVPKTNDFFLESDAGAYAGGIINTAKAYAISDLTQSNEVTVGDGTVIKGVKDVHLRTDEGTPLLFSYSEEESYTVNRGGKEHNDTTNKVTVDGTVEVGIKNQQLVNIAADGSITTVSYTHLTLPTKA